MRAIGSGAGRGVGLSPSARSLRPDGLKFDSVMKNETMEARWYEKAMGPGGVLAGL